MRGPQLVLFRDRLYALSRALEGRQRGALADFFIGWLNSQKNQHSCRLTSADLPSHWYLDRFGREALQNFELLLTIRDPNLKN
jgi:hypothetical protein